MKCGECGDDGANTVEVAFEEGSLKRLELCEDCIEAYREGGLVNEVEAEVE